jgi:hypothetical protein
MRSVSRLSRVQGFELQIRRIVSLTPRFSEMGIMQKNTNRFSGLLRRTCGKLLKQLGKFDGHCNTQLEAGC